MAKNKPIITRREYFISKKVGKAITDYKMLQNKDRVIVGLSGGYDSLALLKILKDRQSSSPVKYDIIAVHIENNGRNAKVIKNYLQKNNYKFYIQKLEKKNSKKPLLQREFAR